MPIYTPFKKPVVSGGFTSSAVSEADSAVYTFSSQAIGTAASDRYVVVAANTATASAADANSVTVGGESASLVVRASGGDHSRVELWIVLVTSGTSADIVITWSSAKDRCGCAAWAIYGASATASDTATDADTTPSQTIDCPAGGIIIAGQVMNGSGATRTASWTGLTEDYDQEMQANTSQTGASDLFTDAVSGRTVAVSPSAGIGLSAMAIASFGPA